MSDGTLRRITLLAMLLNPTPPPLICLEEPELGLHPDLTRALGGMLREAAQRTQVIVTTHSQDLVDSLNDNPEDIVVVEKENGATVASRLARAQLSEWLENYSLGALWRQGEIGGNRW